MPKFYVADGANGLILEMEGEIEEGHSFNRYCKDGDFIIRRKANGEVYQAFATAEEALAKLERVANAHVFEKQRELEIAKQHQNDVAPFVAAERAKLAKGAEA